MVTFHQDTLAVLWQRLRRQRARVAEALAHFD